MFAPGARVRLRIPEAEEQFRHLYIPRQIGDGYEGKVIETNTAKGGRLFCMVMIGGYRVFAPQDWWVAKET